MTVHVKKFSLEDHKKQIQEWIEFKTKHNIKDLKIETIHKEITEPKHKLN